MLNILITFFACPERFIKMATPSMWTDFLQQAREHGLTARFYYVLDKQHLLDKVPEKVKLHGHSAALYAQKQQHTLFFELMQLERFAQSVDYPCVLLKGAAYRANAWDVSFGRLFSDIDLLVPLDKLKQSRDKLFFHGFCEKPMSDYDRDYYLNWSHQNPPLEHLERGSVIDLHHHIYPTASAKKIDITPIFTYAVNMQGSSLKVPTPAHAFLHACVHLFYQEESHKLVKDVIDLHALLLEVENAQQLNFMLEQAKLMSVESALSHACLVLDALFNVHAAKRLLSDERLELPSKGVSRLLLWMLKGKGAKSWLAHKVWFVRGHFLKMHWQVLLYHSIAKPAYNLRRFFKRSSVND